MLKGHIQVEVMEAISVVLENHKSKELKMRRKNIEEVGYAFRFHNCTS